MTDQFSHNKPALNAVMQLVKSREKAG